MPEDMRIMYSKKWIKRGIQTNDPFDKFIYMWIALVIAAQYHRTRTGYFRGETDRERIIGFLEGNIHLVIEIIEKNHDNMVKLATRRGTRFGNSIVDTGNPELRLKFSRLAGHFIGSNFLDEESLVLLLGELLNKIRNNLFHGIKVYDDRDDIELLNLVNPILEGILHQYQFSN